MTYADVQFSAIMRGIRRMESSLNRPLEETERSLYAWAFVDGERFREQEAEAAIAEWAKKMVPIEKAA